MAIVWCGLAPHPPIIVPAVGGIRCREVQATIDCMRSLCADLLARKPDRIVLISPHTPRPRNGAVYWSNTQLSGDFSMFGASDARYQFDNDMEWLARFATAFDGDCYTVNQRGLDHGALVPLHFLVEAGWQGPTAIVGLPGYETQEQLNALGSAIAAASEQQGATALIASGDMSHCLKPGAPAGFDPQGAVFDKAFVTTIKTGDYRKALDIDPELQEQARQDVIGSCHVAWHATSFCNHGSEFLSYEAPFGVGYTVMKFCEV